MPQDLDIKHKDIPENLRRAANKEARLRRAGKLIPDDIRKLSNRYRLWLLYGGQDPSRRGGRKLAHDYIPDELRKARIAVYRKQRNGQDPTKEERDMANEYQRWYRHGGPPPKKRKQSKRRPEPDEAEWPMSAWLTWDKLTKEGIAPGDIPTK